MTISSTSNRNDYTGNDTTAQYNYTSRIFLEGDLEVIVKNTSTDVETELTLTTDYTVAGVGDANGGTISLTSTGQAWMSASNNLDSGYTITIKRVVGLTQDTDIRNQGDFFPETHEDVFDKLTMIDQQQQEELDRTLKLSKTTDAASFDASLPADLAGTASVSIVTNATGDGFETGPTANEIENAQAAAIAAQASATAAAASETLAQEWATNTTGLVEATDYSSKEYAQGTQTRGASGGGSAKDWASYTGGTVDDTDLSAKQHALDAATSAADAQAAAAASQWVDVAFKTFADSPVTISDTDTGTIFVFDCSGGNIVVNLPGISTLDLTNPWSVGIKKTDSSSNTITINRDGTDTIDGGTSKVITDQETGVNCIPDADPTPDEWTTLAFGTPSVLTGRTIDADLNTISNLAHGAEVDNPSSGVHGVTGSVVGTTDTQDLSNKTFTDAITLEEQASTPSNPASGDKKIYAKNDGRLYSLNSAGDEVEIGSGGGGLDVFFTEDLEVNTASTFTSGQAASPDAVGTGTLGGTLADEEASQLSGDRSLKYTMNATAASSNNDFFLNDTDIALDIKQQGNFIGISFYYTYSGADDDIRFFVLDQDDNELTQSDEYIKAASTATRFSTSVFVPSDDTALRYGFQVVTGNSSKVFIVDDLELSSNPFVYKNLAEENVFSARIANNGTVSITSQSGDFIDSVSRTGTGTVVINFVSGYFSTVPSVVVSSEQNTNDSTERVTSVSTSSATIATRDTTLTSLVDIDFNIVVTRQGSDYQAEAEHVVTPAKSNLTDWESYTPTLVGVGTTTNQDIKWRRLGDSIEIQGRWTNGTVTATEFQLPLPSGYTVSSDYSFIQVVGDYQRGASNETFFSALATAGDSFLNVGYRTSSISAIATPTNANTVFGTGNSMYINAKVKVNELTSDATFLAAVPVTLTAIIKDEKSAGTNGGGFTSGSWQTRVLNTLGGDESFISLSSNEFTIPKGKYVVDWKTPAKEVGKHQSRLYNVSDSSVVDYGQIGQTNAAAVNATGYSEGSSVLEITTSKTYRIEHRCQTTNGTDGFGANVNFGGTEVYTIVKVTKIK